MLQLHNLGAPKGANRSRKRVGRGESSGHGKTSGRGMKGQGARTGKGKPRLGFEGGQLPMYRRMPKRGFVNKFAKKWFEINVGMLAERFEAGAVVDFDALVQAGIAKGRFDGVRILGQGDMGHKLTVKAAHFSASAKKKIEEAGGEAIVIGHGGEDVAQG